MGSAGVVGSPEAVGSNPGNEDSLLELQTIQGSRLDVFQQ